MLPGMDNAAETIRKTFTGRPTLVTALSLHTIAAIFE